MTAAGGMFNPETPNPAQLRRAARSKGDTAQPVASEPASPPTPAQLSERLQNLPPAEKRRVATEVGQELQDSVLGDASRSGGGVDAHPLGKASEEQSPLLSAQPVHAERVRRATANARASSADHTPADRP